MEGFITFLFFFVLFMWAMGKIFPHLLAWFVRRRMKKGGMDGFAGFGGPGGFAGFWSNMGPQGGAGNGYDPQEKKQEGKVIISDIPKQEKVIDKEVGEYVDFEE